MNCPNCEIRYTNMEKSTYLQRLVAFFQNSQGPSTFHFEMGDRLVINKEGREYNLIWNRRPGSKNDLIHFVSITFTPVDYDFRADPLKAQVLIRIKDSKIAGIIGKFLEENGELADVPVQARFRF